MATPRYAVMIKRYQDNEPRALTYHRSLREAGRRLGSYISGRRKIRDLDWAFVRDRHCPGENKPGASCVISRNQILRVT